jgi:SAM-dependent methyltransferase
MSVAYRVLYALGVTPWERMGASPAIRAQIASLFERHENNHRPPYGPALDLGCGSGIWAVELARRGWDVTAVDNVPKALRRAGERAREERVEPRFVHGDVTALGEADIGSGYRLLVDFGCFHDELTEEQRAAEGRGASAAAAPDATLLLMAWKPGRRGILPRGASPEEIEAAFPGWEIVDEEPMDVTDAPGWVRRGEPRFYTLRR